jgi:hypothetical protein
MLPVQVPWLSTNFEGPCAILAARVLAKLPGGALAFAGQAVEALLPSTLTLERLEFEGKRGEKFVSGVDRQFFSSRLGRGSSARRATDVPKTRKAAPNLSQVLFDIYTPEAEKWYLTRDLDARIDALLQAQMHIWLSGPAGVGKSTILRRWLLLRDADSCYVSLASYVGATPLQLVRHLRTDLADALGVPAPPERSRTLAEAINQCAQILSSSTSASRVLYIDELPFDTDAAAAGVVRALAAILTISWARAPNAPLRIFLSSIANPAPLLTLDQRKLHERMQIVPLACWKDDELRKLADLVLSGDGLQLARIDRDAIVRGSEGSPRALKNILRRVSIVGEHYLGDLDEIMREVRRELG